MDPSAALANIRQLMTSLENQVNEGVADWDDMQELAQQFRDLDVWLTKGGFLPLDWYPLESK